MTSSPHTAACLLLPLFLGCTWALTLTQKDSPPSQYGDPASVLAGCTGFTCVQRYCAFKDGAFHWEVHSGPKQASDSRSWELQLISQAWMTESTGVPWHHRLSVVIPDSLHSKSKAAGWAIITIDGDQPGPDAEELARRTGAVTVGLGTVPNEHLNFRKEGVSHTEEEALKAWSWVQASRHPSHPEWPIEMPSVKAVVRGMDAVVAFIEQLGHLHVPPIERFIITGESKRGMATWMAGAVDDRVHGIVPLVMPLHRLQFMNETAANLGAMQVSCAPYLEQGVYDMTPDERNFVFPIIDPYYYMDRLTMPKLIVNVGGDQFFPPDSTRGYLSSLPEPKSFFMMGNAQHGGFVVNPFMYDEAEGFIKRLMHGLDPPRFEWNISSSDGTISARHLSGPRPLAVRLWQAMTREHRLRDFRGVLWSPVALPSKSESWQARVSPEAGRWTGFYIEFEYPVGGNSTGSYLLSTEVSVVPVDRPFPGASPFIQKYQRLV